MGCPPDVSTIADEDLFFERVCVVGVTGFRTFAVLLWLSFFSAGLDCWRLSDHRFRSYGWCCGWHCRDGTTKPWLSEELPSLNLFSSRTRYAAPCKFKHVGTTITRLHLMSEERTTRRHCMSDEHRFPNSSARTRYQTAASRLVGARVMPDALFLSHCCAWV